MSAHRLIPLSHSSILLASAQLAGLVLSLVGSALIARGLGPADRGSLAALLAFQSLALTVAYAGVDTLHRKLPAETPDVAATLKWNSVWHAAIVLAMIVVLCLYLSVRHDQGTISLASMLLTLMALPFLTVQGLANSVELGCGQAAGTARSELAKKSLFVFLIVLLWQVALLDIYTVLIAALFVTTVGAAISLHNLGLICPGGNGSFSVYRERSHFIISAFAFSMAWQAVQRFDVLALSIYAAPEEAGYFAVAQALVEAWIIPASATATMLLPTLGALSRSDWLGLSFRTSTVMLLIYSAGSVLLFIWSAPIVSLLFGGGYFPAVDVFRWLLCASVFTAGFLIAQTILMGVGRPYLLLFPISAGLIVKTTLFSLCAAPNSIAMAKINAVAAAVCFATAFATQLYLLQPTKKRSRIN